MVKMLFKKLGIFLTAVVLVLIPVVAACSATAEDNDRETLTQVSTLNALMAGFYNGVVSLDEMQPYGDTGIGTFESLDGEMVVLDGRFYQVKADGKAYAAAGDVKSPFLCLTFFDSDATVSIPAGTDYPGLQALLDAGLPTYNIFYAFKISGTFSYMKTRSVPAQSQPYPPLADVTASQPVFDFNDVKGTLVGFRCPAYVEGVNVPGYHLHFLTEDRTAGGHVLEFTVAEAEAEIDYTPDFNLSLPEGNADFYALNLSGDTSEDIQKVEK
jgi:acetolactate decarboxylase